MKNNNKGFTLIEVIVVIAIIAIMSTVFVSTMSQVTIAELGDAATSTAALLSHGKVSTLSGEPNVTVEIWGDAGGFYGAVYSDGRTQNEEKLIKAGTVVSYTDASGGGTIDSGDTLEITFNRNTGAFESPSGISSISFSAGNTIRTVEITASTGYITTT